MEIKYKILSLSLGAKADQVKHMKSDEKKSEETQQLVDKYRQVLLKVIKTKLREIYIQNHKELPGSDLRAVHLEILQKNLLN